MKFQGSPLLPPISRRRPSKFNTKFYSISIKFLVKYLGILYGRRRRGKIPTGHNAGARGPISNARFVRSHVLKDTLGAVLFLVSAFHF